MLPKIIKDWVSLNAALNELCANADCRFAQVYYACDLDGKETSSCKGESWKNHYDFAHVKRDYVPIVGWNGDCLEYLADSPDYDVSDIVPIRVDFILRNQPMRSIKIEF